MMYINLPFRSLCACVTLALMLCACGGGTDGTATPLGATLTPAVTKSAVQQSFESATLNTGGGYNNILWATGSDGSLTSLFAVRHVLASSPADANNKTATFSVSPTSLSGVLPVPTQYTSGQSGFFSMVIDDNGALARAVDSANSNVTYNGDNIRVTHVTLSGEPGYVTSLDNLTTVPLSAGVADTMQKLLPLPATIVKPFDTVRTWSQGAAYYKVQLSYPADQVFLFDWDDNSATDPNSLTPILNGSVGTLEQAFPWTSPSDKVTYQFTDGIVSTYNGRRIWVANNARPISSAPTTEFRIMVEVGSVVYTGAMLKQGTIVKNRPFGAPSDGTQDVDYRTYWNDQAIADIKAAIQF